MSYEIYTSITYNKKTRCFDCRSYSNNVYPKTPTAWTMGYYAKKYPDATEQELKALLILGSLWNGDQYYAAWAKKYKQIAIEWSKGRDTLNYKDVENIETARDLMRYYDARMAAKNQAKKSDAADVLELIKTIAYMTDGDGYPLPAHQKIAKIQIILEQGGK